MERTSSKHGPHLDDQMKREVESLTKGSPIESRADEGRLHEAAGEDQPSVDAGAPVGKGDLPDSVPDREGIEERSKLPRSLDQHIFPARRDDLIENASENNAEDRVLRILQSLPEEGPFDNVQQVWEANGGQVEEERF